MGHRQTATCAGARRRVSEVSKAGRRFLQPYSPHVEPIERAFAYL